MRNIDKIIIHCSDTPPSMDIGAAEIRRWHTDPQPKGNGWSDIGYHYVTRRNGKIESGRAEDIAGTITADVASFYDELIKNGPYTLSNTGTVYVSISVQASVGQGYLEGSSSPQATLQATGLGAIR